MKRLLFLWMLLAGISNNIMAQVDEIPEAKKEGTIGGFYNDNRFVNINYNLDNKFELMFHTSNYLGDSIFKPTKDSVYPDYSHFYFNVSLLSFEKKALQVFESSDGESTTNFNLTVQARYGRTYDKTSIKPFGELISDTVFYINYKDSIHRFNTKLKALEFCEKNKVDTTKIAIGKITSQKEFDFSKELEKYDVVKMVGQPIKKWSIWTDFNYSHSSFLFADRSVVNQDTTIVTIDDVNGNSWGIIPGVQYLYGNTTLTAKKGRENNPQNRQWFLTVGASVNVQFNAIDPGGLSKRTFKQVDDIAYLDTAGKKSLAIVPKEKTYFIGSVDRKLALTPRFDVSYRVSYGKKQPYFGLFGSAFVSSYDGKSPTYYYGLGPTVSLPKLPDVSAFSLQFLWKRPTDEDIEHSFFINATLSLPLNFGLKPGSM